MLLTWNILCEGATSCLLVCVCVCDMPRKWSLMHQLALLGVCLSRCNQTKRTCRLHRTRRDSIPKLLIDVGIDVSTTYHIAMCDCVSVESECIPWWVLDRCLFCAPAWLRGHNWMVCVRQEWGWAGHGTKWHLRRCRAWCTERKQFSVAGNNMLPAKMAIIQVNVRTYSIETHVALINV